MNSIAAAQRIAQQQHNSICLQFEHGTASEHGHGKLLHEMEQPWPEQEEEEESGT
jgi:hypothetical protein